MSPARLHAAFAVLCALAPALAAANGVNPPQRKDTVAVTATCHVKAANRQHTLYRAQIGDARGTRSDTLRVRSGAATETVSLQALQAIEISAAAPDAAGYVAVTLMRRGSDQKEGTALRVRDSGSALRLVGYLESGLIFGFDIASCARIEFPASRSVQSPLYTDSVTNDLKRSQIKDRMGSESFKKQ